MHLLYSQSNRAKDWSLRFHDVASNVGNAYAEPYIMVEIIETLDTLYVTPTHFHPMHMSHAELNLH
jgi:hypothetical protein